MALASIEPSSRAPVVPGAGHVAARTESVLELLIVIAGAMLVTLGTPLLALMGLSYNTVGGNFLQKIHPSTYMVMLAFGWLILRSGGPFAYLERNWPRQQAEFFFLATLLVITWLGFIRLGSSGLAYMIDAFVAPTLFALILPQLSGAGRRRVFQVVFWLLVLNAGIAVAEVAVSRHLIGFTDWAGAEFRAAGLLGHPLNNALITVPAVILAFRCMAGGHGLTMPLVLLCLSLLAFGGRAAAVVALLTLATLAVVDVTMHLARRTMTLQRCLLYSTILLIGPLSLAVVLATTDLGHRIIQRLFFDNSTMARLEAWQIFRYLKPDELWLGTSSNTLVNAITNLANSTAIENFWVYLIANFGIAKFTLFAVAFFFFLRKMTRQGDYFVALTVLTFIGVASTNNSLASKTTALSVMVVLAMTFGDYLHGRINAKGGRPALPGTPRTSPNPPGANPMHE